MRVSHQPLAALLPPLFLSPTSHPVMILTNTQLKVDSALLCDLNTAVGVQIADVYCRVPKDEFSEYEMNQASDSVRFQTLHGEEGEPEINSTSQSSSLRGRRKTGIDFGAKRVKDIISVYLSVSPYVRQFFTERYWRLENWYIIQKIKEQMPMAWRSGYNGYRPDQATSSVAAAWMGDRRVILSLKQPACPANGGGSQVTFKPLVRRLKVREGFLALTSPGKITHAILLLIVCLYVHLPVPTTTPTRQETLNLACSLILSPYENTNGFRPKKGSLPVCVMP
ncbi:hypothetical protein J6590_002276 [Homalodisca vitripennis]|nr:hypothetical protein J6590_002276 [Homalodisca vitripennis]